METLDLAKLKRKPDIINAKIQVSNNMVFAKEDLKMLFPIRYINRELAIIDTVIKVTCIVAIMDEEFNYGVLSIPIMHEITPYLIEDVSVDNVEYKSMLFKKDTVICPNTNSIMSGAFLYNLFDEFYIKGNVPFYISYEDLATLFSKTTEFAGSNIGSNQLAYELITANITRTLEDKSKLYKEKQDGKYVVIGLNNRYYSFDTTGAKLVGGYMKEGVSTAIVSPETKTSNYTNILRS